MHSFRWESRLKSTEIGDLPSEWRLGRLRDAVQSLQSGSRPKGGKLIHLLSGILNIGGENLTWQGELALEECFRVSRDFYTSANKGKIDRGDILLVKDGATIGKLAYIAEVPEGEAMINEHVFLIRTRKSEYTPGYLFYYLSTEAGQTSIENSTGGSAQEGINRSILDTIVIPIPDPVEQSRIATILSWFDNLVENKRKQNKVLEKVAMAIFKDWFIDFEHFKVEELANTELGEIPKGWEVKPIGEVAHFDNGLSYLRKEKYTEPVEGSYVFITLNNAVEGGGFKAEYFWIKSDRLRDRYFLEEGDLIITNIHFGVGGSDVGRLMATPALVTFPPSYGEKKAVYSMDITKISPLKNQLKPYLYLYLKFTREDSVSFSTGTGILHLDIKNFIRNKMVVCPPDQILVEFASLVQPLFQKISTNLKQIIVLTKIRNTLLPLLVSGRLRSEEI